MLSQEELDAIKNIAIIEAKSPTFDSWYRSLCRWYSREFSTPLKEVLDYPYAFVFQTYYEDVFYNLSVGNDEAKKKLDEALEDAINESRSDEEIEEIQEDEDDWYQEEMKAIQKEFASQSVVEVEDELPDDFED